MKVFNSPMRLLQYNPHIGQKPVLNPQFVTLPDNTMIHIPARIIHQHYLNAERIYSGQVSEICCKIFTIFLVIRCQQKTKKKKKYSQIQGLSEKNDRSSGIWQRGISKSLYTKSSSIEGCLLLKVIFHQRSFTIKGCLPSKVIFNKRLSSINGRLPPKVVFHQRLSFLQRSSSIVVSNVF